jgi:uncharacterized membrane protein
MANKNKNVIIAYFPSAAAAEGASESLKMWDKANDQIKLGGIGILTSVNGEIKEHKVGAKATGTGAKVGATLGIITGILSGGVTLVGGALVGMAGGALLGAIKHKGLGLTDADMQTFKTELASGKAALVVTADDHEVEPTKARIVEFGGTVTSFAAALEAVEAIEQVAAEVEHAPESAATPAATDAAPVTPPAPAPDTSSPADSAPGTLTAQA